MPAESSTTTILRFTGDWPVLTVLGIATGLGLAMFFYYRLELRRHDGLARWVPALLRALAVFFLVLCLLEPILQHSTTYRQLGRVVIAVDTSGSMGFTDDMTANTAAKPGSSGAAKPQVSQPRFTRAEHALLDPTTGLIKQIQGRHDLELFLLKGSHAERIWWNRDQGQDVSGDLPSQFGVKPDATITNLDQPLHDALGPSPAGSALIVLSDGQHNAQGSPEALASALKESDIPIFTVGYGSEIPPPDLALLNVVVPEAVFAEDRAEGTMVLYDSLPAGLTGLATVSYLNKTLWQQPFTTTGTGERHMEFSFPVHDLAQAGAGNQSLRLVHFKAELVGSAVGKDRIPNNNERTVAIHLLTRKRRALVLDGTARWETRYLKNYFELNDRWQVTAAFDDHEKGPKSAIGAAFPKDKEAMMSYDLIVMGDLRPDALTKEQQEMITEFVEKRGGGLILVDGRHGHMPEWSQTKVGPLVPVSWTGKAAPAVPMHYTLNQQGEALEALRLSDSASANLPLWKKLPDATWCSSAEALPGSTTLADLVEDGQKFPVMVSRRVGAGSVLWLGTDQLWRWRYEVGDLLHQRFWMQIGSWIAAPPFLAENARVSIGTDHLRYQEGGSAEVKVRLRNEKGTVVTDAKPRAHLFRSGIEIASYDLEPDPTHGGVFRTMTGQLSAGDYQIAVSEGTGPMADLRLPFRAESQANQEWGQLNMNRPLLEAMARNSGGRFFREGDIAQLPEVLQMLDHQQTRFTETNLWSSWWLLGTVVLLLTVEWLLRKLWRLV